MAVNVTPPPFLQIPEKFINDPELRTFFEREKQILFELFLRTGGSFDKVAGKQIVVVTNIDITLDAFGALIVVEADTSEVNVTLPIINSGNVGETVDIAIIDATFDTIVHPQNATIFGDTSVVMTQQYMSIQYTAVATDTWIGT